MDNDNSSDIIVGAPYNDEAGDRAGKTYLVSGTSILAGGDHSLSSAFAMFLGETAGDQSGEPVAYAGDVNGDGLGDLVIGATQNDEGGDTAGKTYLFFSDSIAGGGTYSLSLADVSLVGEVSSASGFAVSGAGDVDGDGLHDILIGAPNDDQVAISAGKTYLMFGSTVQAGGEFDLASADAVFLGEAEQDWSGVAVSNGGDVDGDGLAELLIGAHSNDGAGLSNAGKTYLMFGSTVQAGGEFDLASADVAFLGTTEAESSGLAVSVLGDLDGDGSDDLIIGAPSCDDYAYRAGKIYLLYSPY